MVQVKSSRFAKLKSLSQSPRNRVVIIAAFLVLAGLVIYFFLQYQKNQSLLKNPNLASGEEAKMLVDKVGKLIELPVNESPTIATVSDKTKLQNQPFFTNAQNGDKVLIYSNAKKAILYRPGINKIIEVAPVNVGSNSNPQITSNPIPSVTEEPKILRVVIYNGTKTAGLAGSAAAKLSEKLSNVNVVKKADASNEYEETLIIDLSGTNSQALTQFTDVVGGKTQTIIPSGEVKPDADVLIILGTDFTDK